LADQASQTDPGLLDGDDGSTALAGRLAVARGRAKELGAQLARITEAAPGRHDNGFD
jgi:hypothetical protein